MSSNRSLRAYLYASVAVGAVSVATTGAYAAPCQGPGAPTTTQTKCFTAVQIPGNPLRSFDISWVGDISPANGGGSRYMLADRSNAGIDIIDTQTLTFRRTIGGFVGIKLNSNGTVNNNISGPDGVTSHGRWVYAGDGDSTLKVIDLLTQPPIKQTIPTGGTTRVDELAISTDGSVLLAANNAEDPPFATLFTANRDNAVSNVNIIRRITVDPAIIPAGFGLSLEQPAWNHMTHRFYTSIPIIANNPSGCNYGQFPDISPGVPAPITCNGGVLVTDWTSPQTVQGAYDPTTDTGVVPLKNCGPNGASTGPDQKVVMLGCTPGNNPSNIETTILNVTTPFQYTNAGVTGSDEVWYNGGTDNRYYLGASKSNGGVAGTPFKAVLGVVDAATNIPIETIPQSSNSHSVAADDEQNFIFVPQVAPVAVVGAGGDTTTVGAQLCGSNNGCVVVYRHNPQEDAETGQE